MKKSIIVILILFACRSPKLEGKWTASNFYSSESGQPLQSLTLPFESLKFFSDSVSIGTESVGIVRDKIGQEDHLIFLYRDTTRYFIVKELSSDMLLLETSSFNQGQRALLSLRR